MITDEYIRQEFVSGVVSKGIGEVYDLISATLQTKVKGEAAEQQMRILAADRMLQDGNGRFEMTIGIGLRLLDIRYSHIFCKKLPIYNHAVWPYMYNRVLPKLRYGFTEDVRNKITAELQVYGETK